MSDELIIGAMYKGGMHQGRIAVKLGKSQRYIVGILNSLGLIEIVNKNAKGGGRRIKQDGVVSRYREYQREYMRRWRRKRRNPD